jgi:hypothetical protein
MTFRRSSVMLGKWRNSAALKLARSSWGVMPRARATKAVVFANEGALVFNDEVIRLKGPVETDDRDP